MKNEQEQNQSQDIAEGIFSRAWVYNRFGVDETPMRENTFEKRMEEAGGDPRVMATIAEAEARGFDMKEGRQYSVER